MKPLYIVSGLVLACAAAVLSLPSLKEKLPGLSTKAAGGALAIAAPGDANLTDLPALQKRADNLIAQKDYVGALEVLNEAVATDDGNANLVDVWKDRAFLRSKLDDRPGALHDINTAIDLGADSAWTWSWRGRLHLELGDLDAAIADLGAALERDPDYCHALRRVRQIVYPIERLAREGKDTLSPLDDPEQRYEIRILVSKHLAAAEGNEYREAIRILDRLIKITDQPEFLILQRARLKVRAGELEAAIDELGLIFQPRGHYQKVRQGQIARSKKLRDNGKSCASKEVISVANHFTLLPEKIAEETVLTLVKMGDLEKALIMLNAWLETAPLNNEMWLWRGNILAALGDRDQALASYEEALKLIDTREGQDHRDDWMHLETLYRIKSNYDDTGRSGEIFAVFEASLAVADNSLHWNLREMMDVAGHFEGDWYQRAPEKTKAALKGCLADTACHWEQILPKMSNQRTYRGKNSILRY